MPLLWAMFAVFIFFNAIMPLLLFFRPFPKKWRDKVDETLLDDYRRDFEQSMELRRKRRAERENEQ
jgi:hypothetical protein